MDIPELRNKCQYVSPTLAHCYIPDLIWQGVQIMVVPGYASLAAYAVGAGKPFTLVDSAGATQVAACGHTIQSNIDSDNTLSFRINGSATGDLAARLSMFPWMVSGQYLVNAGATDLGSGCIWLGQSANWLIQADFTVPSGATVVSVPNDWTPVVNGAPDFSAMGQPGFTGWNATLSLTINVDSDTSNDTAAFAIPAYGS